MLAAAKQIRGDNLERELTTAGFPNSEASVALDDDMRRVLTIDGPNATEQNRNAMQAVIDNHTGQPTEEQQRPIKARQKVEGAIAQFEADYANWGALTNAQKDAANRRAQLALAKLGRFLAGKFDVPE